MRSNTFGLKCTETTINFIYLVIHPRGKRCHVTFAENTVNVGMQFLPWHQERKQTSSNAICSFRFSYNLFHEVMPMFRGTFNVVNNEGCKNWTCDGGLEIPPRLLCAILNVPPSTSKNKYIGSLSAAMISWTPRLKCVTKRCCFFIKRTNISNTCVQ